MKRVDKDQITTLIVKPCNLKTPVPKPKNDKKRRLEGVGPEEGVSWRFNARAGVSGFLKCRVEHLALGIGLGAGPQYLRLELRGLGAWGLGAFGYGRVVDPCRDGRNIGALIIRIRIWEPLYYHNYKKEPPK